MKRIRVAHAVRGTSGERSGILLLAALFSGLRDRQDNLSEDRRQRDRWSRELKRAADVVGAMAGLVAMSPVMGAVAIGVGWSVGRPVMYQQERPGLDGRPFVIHKFRTMTNEADSAGNLLPDGERLTRLGLTLRRWSLDELPELWNVLRGDMSLVGPRPLLTEYLDLYTEEQMRRHEMRPGLTGLAQISGRNGQTWEDRLALDVWYVDRWNLWMDTRILARTVVKVLRREGITASGHATMPAFRGSTSSLGLSEPGQRGMS